MGTYTPYSNMDTHQFITGINTTFKIETSNRRKVQYSVCIENKADAELKNVGL